MAYLINDLLAKKTNGLVETFYTGSNFNLCRVAQWAYMAVVVLEDTSDDEDEPTRITLACWHIDSEFGKKIMENNALFAATMLSKKTGKDADLVVTIDDKQNPLADIRKEVESGVRKPIEDPGFDRMFKEQETQRLKVFIDKFGENPQFSPKKVWPGMLMLLVYPLGLPFFYFNKPKWGLISLALMVLGCIIMPLLIVGGLVGCVLIVMLLIHVLGNKAKDKDGLWICTQKDQKMILENIAKYKQNVAELEAEREQA